MTDMEERHIEGKLAFWTKEVREEPNPATGQTVFNLGFKMADSEEWHNVYAVEKSPLEKLKESAPNGSKIAFDEIKAPGAKRWTFKHGTFNVLEKGSGYTGGNKNKGWETKEERQARQLREVAVKAIDAALSLVNTGKIQLKEWPDYADQFERRVMASNERLKNPGSDAPELEEEDVE